MTVDDGDGLQVAVTNGDRYTVNPAYDPNTTPPPAGSDIDGDATDALIAAAREVMEAAALPAVALSVPLTVDAGAGANWAAAH